MTVPVSEGTPVAGDPVVGDPVAGTPVTGDPVAGTPVTGDPVAGTPVTGDPVEAAETTTDPYEAYGGKDAVEAAISWHKAAQTEDGVTQLFIEAGRSLGLSMEQMEALFPDPATPGVMPQGTEEDPDRPLTAKEVRELMDKEIRKPLEAQRQEATFAAARQTISETFKSLGVEDTATQQAILRLGDQHLDANDLSPTAVADAVRKGHESFQSLVAANAQGYLKKKQEQAEATPKSPAGGASAGSTTQPEPQNVAEAIARVRAQLTGAS